MDTIEEYYQSLSHVLCRPHLIPPPGQGRFTVSLRNIIPAITQYLIPVRHECKFEWWRLPRFMIHGMRDVTGLIREYLAYTAVAVTFDYHTRPWILWRRRADRSLVFGLRGTSWDECRPVPSPPDCLHYEVQIYDAEPVFKFFTEDQADEWYNVAHIPQHMFVSSSCSEFYVGFMNGKLRVTAFGINIDVPDGIVGMRPCGATIYGLLPSGELVICGKATRQLFHPMR